MRRAIVAAAALTALMTPGAPVSPSGTAWAQEGGAGNPRPDAPVSATRLRESVKVLRVDQAVHTIEVGDSVSPLEERSTSDGKTTVRLSSDVLFEFGESALTDAARKRLSAIAATLRGATGRILVVGHTDSVGSARGNLRLSQRRAAAVKAHLERELGGGVAIVAAGRGERDPVAPNTKAGEDNPAGRAKNRRVEITYRG